MAGPAQDATYLATQSFKRSALFSQSDEIGSHHLSTPGLNLALQSDLCGSDQNAPYYSLCGPIPSIPPSDGQSVSILSHPNFQSFIQYGDVTQSTTDNSVAFRHVHQPSPTLSLPLAPIANDNLAGKVQFLQKQSPLGAQLHSIPQYAQADSALTLIHGGVYQSPLGAKLERQHYLANDYCLRSDLNSRTAFNAPSDPLRRDIAPKYQHRAERVRGPY